MWSLGFNHLASRVTVEAGGVWLRSRVWKVDQNRVAVVKPRDD